MDRQTIEAIRVAEQMWLSHKNAEAVAAYRAALPRIVQLGAVRVARRVRQRIRCIARLAAQ